MMMTIPLEENPKIAALVGCVAGHASLMSAMFVVIFQIIKPLEDVTVFSKAPAKQKRKTLKDAANTVLSTDAKYQLTDFLDNTAAPLEFRRGNLMHDLWSNGDDGSLGLMPTPHGVRRDMSVEKVSEETLQSLLLEYKSANARALSLLSLINSHICGPPTE